MPLRRDIKHAKRWCNEGRLEKGWRRRNTDSAWPWRSLWCGGGLLKTVMHIFGKVEMTSPYHEPLQSSPHFFFKLHSMAWLLRRADSLHITIIFQCDASMKLSEHAIFHPNERASFSKQFIPAPPYAPRRTCNKLLKLTIARNAKLIGHCRWNRATGDSIGCA